MTAKKNKIRALQHELTEKNQMIQNLQTTIRMRDRAMEEIKLKIDDQLGRIYWQCEQITKHFTKEFTWMELTDDPDSQFKYLKRSLKSIKHMAELHGDKSDE